MNKECNHSKACKEEQESNTKTNTLHCKQTTQQNSTMWVPSPSKQFLTPKNMFNESAITSNCIIDTNTYKSQSSENIFVDFLWVEAEWKHLHCGWFYLQKREREWRGETTNYNEQAQNLARFRTIFMPSTNILMFYK